MSLFTTVDKALLVKFKRYHRSNPHVYESFKSNAYLMKRTGRKKYSAWTIINKMRWDEDLKTTGGEFIINNNYIALYARLLITFHPEFLNFFDLRPMKPNRKQQNKAGGIHV